MICTQSLCSVTGGAELEKAQRFLVELLPSRIRSRRVTKRCGRHAEQNRAHIKMCTRPKVVCKGIAQVWKCPQRNEKGAVLTLSNGLPRR